VAKAVRAILLVLLLLVIDVPFVLTLLVQDDPLGRAWLASPKLGNVVFQLRPAWTLSGWTSGDFQRRTDRWFADVVEPRGYAIPLTNQLYYVLFAKSHMYDRTIVIGRDRELYERSYVAAYCHADEARAMPALASLADDLGVLHEGLARDGKVLLILVTPSKAAVLPGLLPSAACRPPLDPDATRHRFVSLLRDRGVPVIDGHAVVMAMRAEDPLPPFPRGGTHWSRLVGVRVAGIVMREVDRLGGADLGGVDARNVRWDARPEKSDRDLADLLKLLVSPDDYRVAAWDAACRTTPLGRSRNLVSIGGSFLFQVLDPIIDCGLFRQVENYFYYDTLYQRWPGGHSKRPDRAKIDWRSKLAATDVLILEIGEHLIGHAPHVEHFVSDVLVQGAQRKTRAGEGL
jgi:acetyltransferase AlgX (SGNH hydrolase-like protein)